jgi:anti-anti-sigma regulatory factor
MLKIVPIENGSDAPVLVLEGVVIGPWVEELRRSCERLLAESRVPILDLASVSFVDRDGIELLRRLQDSHVVLSNCSRFVNEQLKGR